jgi:hypothetical protein
MDSSNGYYGELTLQYAIKMKRRQIWLYLDYITSQNAPKKSELILEGEHYDYLAKI